MPILRPFFIPTVGEPQPVVAPARRRTMVNPQFYGQRAPKPEDVARMLPMRQQESNPVITQEQAPDRMFEQEASTGNRLQEQFQRFRQRAAPPSLEPGARVKPANTDLVAPSNFQKFYETLNLIDDIGQQQLATAQAQSAFKRQQAMQAVLNQGPPAPNQGGGNYTGPTGTMPAPGNINQVQSTVRNMAAQMGWTGGEWDALYRLVMNESGWRPNAANPTSSARGLFQKMINLHGPIESTVEGQARWGLDYIRRRYGSPSRALAHWQARVPIGGRDVGHWY